MYSCRVLSWSECAKEEWGTVKDIRRTSAPRPSRCFGCFFVLLFYFIFLKKNKRVITVFKYSERRLGSTSSAPLQTPAPLCLLNGGRSFGFPSMILTRIEIRMKDSAWSCRDWSSALISRRSAFLKSGLTAKLCLWLSVWESKKRWQMADWMGRVAQTCGRSKTRWLACAQTLAGMKVPVQIPHIQIRGWGGGIDFNFHPIWIDSSSRQFFLWSSVREMFRTRGGEKKSPASIDLFVSKGGFYCFFVLPYITGRHSVRDLFKGEPSFALCPVWMQATSFEKRLFFFFKVPFFPSLCPAAHLFPFIDSLNTVIWSVVLRSAVITQQIIVQIKHFYPSEIIYPQPVSFIQKVCLFVFFFSTVCHRFLKYNGFLARYPFRWHGHEWIPLTDLWNVCLSFKATGGKKTRRREERRGQKKKKTFTLAHEIICTTSKILQINVTNCCLRAVEANKPFSFQPDGSFDWSGRAHASAELITSK